MSKKPRTKTKTGKPLDPKTGKIRGPKKGQIAKTPDGKLVRVDDSNMEEVTRAKRTTNLGRVEKPEGAPPPQTAKGEQRVSTVRGVGTPAKGAAGSYPIIKGLVEQARMHLSSMQATHGTPEFHQHHESFNQVHATLAIGAPDIHTSLKYARDFVASPGENSQKHLTLAHKAIDDRLSIYKNSSESNIENSQAGYQERMRKIRAERNPS
jgi:hypothetical protein